MTARLSPEELRAVKEDLLSSLHCALPGAVVRFDPDRGTADVRPGVKTRSGLALPLLRDVPVFRPAEGDIAPGDLCLVVFADCDIDGWLRSGETAAPPSARRHSLSDGFAFVGFRRGGDAG